MSQIVKLIFTSKKVFRNRDPIKVVRKHVKLDRGITRVTQKRGVGYPGRGVEYLNSFGNVIDKCDNVRLFNETIYIRMFTIAPTR